MHFSEDIQFKKNSSKFAVLETKMIPNYAVTFHENIYCLCKQRNSSDMIRMIAYIIQMYVTIMQADHTQRSAGARIQPKASCISGAVLN
jgi:alcohol dehydrogenase YqhD (iron-dependent ADH family)